jgi:Clustered mitochondria
LTRINTIQQRSMASDYDGNYVAEEGNYDDSREPPSSSAVSSSSDEGEEDQGVKEKGEEMGGYVPYDGDGSRRDEEDGSDSDDWSSSGEDDSYAHYGDDVPSSSSGSASVASHGGEDNGPAHRYVEFQSPGFTPADDDNHSSEGRKTSDNNNKNNDPDVITSLAPKWASTIHGHFFLANGARGELFENLNPAAPVVFCLVCCWNGLLSSFLFPLFVMFPDIPSIPPLPPDWNAEFQKIMELPLDDPAAERWLLLRELANEFTSTARQLGRIIISEFAAEHKTIPPAKLGGVAGGDKYEVSGIIFK